MMLRLRSNTALKTTLRRKSFEEKKALKEKKDLQDVLKKG